MRLVLVRHGETEHNAEGLTLGRADVPLNERGLRQARALAGLANGVHMLADSPPITAVYSSPLQRSLATAQPLAAALQLEVQQEPDLVEMDVGETEGIPLKLLRERHADFLRRWLSEDVADVRMPGGETLREVQERAWSTIEGIARRHAGESTIAVTHNFVLLAVLCRAMNLPLAKFRSLRQDLAAISVLDVSVEATRVIVLNDRCHLAEAGVNGS